MPKAQKQSAPSRPQKSGTVRMISGAWRGRKVPVLDSPGLRPTPDRIRETLFNWLQGELVDATCIDLFAGTGALGLECLSRGARFCHFIDQQSAVCRHLNTQLQTLGGTSKSQVHCTAAADFVNNFTDSAEVVFIDPPYHHDLIEPLLATLSGWQTRWFYIETASDETLPPVPEHWSLHREVKAGQVLARLFYNTLTD